MAKASEEGGGKRGSSAFSAGAAAGVVTRRAPPRGVRACAVRREPGAEVASHWWHCSVRCSALLQPFDVVKTRLQAQAATGGASRRARRGIARRGRLATLRVAAA
jgi:hypothetical protein